MHDDTHNDTYRGELVVYQTDDGQARIECRLIDETIWLSQAQLAELFGRSKPTIIEHLSNIFVEGELPVNSVVRNFRTTASDGKSYDVIHYNLQAILAVGFRIKSPRGTEFRKWANTQLKELIVKGFILDDERLKNPHGSNYFDELLARLRDIRASEQRFYQKVRELFSLSVDYGDDQIATSQFFAETQNKLLFAVTGYTAAEIVFERANPKVPNMGLTSWQGSRVRKHDIYTAKNYLTLDEIDSLNRLVALFLEQAELRVKNHHQLTMDFWRNNVDSMLQFSEKAVLNDAGSISHEAMQSTVDKRYSQYVKDQRIAALKAADKMDEDDLLAIENLEHQATALRNKSPKPPKTF